MRTLLLAASLLAGTLPLAALDPGKALTQFSSTTWTQEQGLPQDTVRALAQTPDGYLWVGTEEGLARFDGYDFVTFTKDQGHLLSNSIMALAVGRDGSLWIGTTQGLTRYQNRRFLHYTVKDGLPDDSISALLIDHASNLWIVAQGNLARFDGTRFTTFLRERDLPLSAATAISEDRNGTLYVVGFNSVAKFDQGKFVRAAALQPGAVPRGLKIDHQGNIWVLRTRGLVRYGAGGIATTLGPPEGLPDALGYGALLEDRDHNLWIGAGNKLARLEQGRPESLTEINIGDPDSVRCLLEDSQGNLWIGSSNGLRRLRDGPFTVFGKAEGLPSDEPSTVYQDRGGTVWVGFGDGGAAAFRPGPKLNVTRFQNITRNRVFAFRQTRSGELLIAAGDGLARVHGKAVTHYVPTGDPIGRKYVYDALEGADGQLWLALPNGLSELRDGRLRNVIAGGPTTEDAIATLAAGSDGSVWAGGRRSLWQVKGPHVRRFTTADGLTSTAIASLYADSGGALWIGTAGGGLNVLRNGKFHAFRARDGLLSDNISKVVDDGESLWLSTARGTSRVPKKQLWDFAEGRISSLRPVTYGAADGLHSAAYSPTAGAGGGHFSGGNLWLVTSRGVALHQPRIPGPPERAPTIDLTEMSSEGKPLDWTAKPQVPAGNGRVQIRYTAVDLRAPERVQYSYRLDGLDSDWIRAGARRGVNYDGLRHGSYKFHVKAELPDGVGSERAFVFDVLPHFYETTWFRVAMAGILGLGGWAIYKLRERRVRSEFAAVLEERARLAREVHDTLAQGFVGISSQLDVVEMCLPKEATTARGTLDLARRMARHSLTEARRSVMDLRSAALEDDGLAAALESGVRMWTASSGVQATVEIVGQPRELPEDVAHHMLRIAQEAVTNAMNHAHATHISLKLNYEPKHIELQATDDGCGFEHDDAFTSAHGHFGLIGMRERAERLGGQLSLESNPGEGTRLAIRVPLT